MWGEPFKIRVCNQAYRTKNQKISEVEVLTEDTNSKLEEHEYHSGYDYRGYKKDEVVVLAEIGDELTRIRKILEAILDRWSEK